ncbi:hypothetical protein H2248_011838 [Termitomyces sp. 'cryptogamus']|nr:hypothetical protein H2248_011838 [Termitomyces sp. 'cryptogamus']
MASIPTNLTPTLGVYEIGVLISMFLFGLVTVQTFTYYKKFPKDPWYLRLYVGVLWFTELVHTMLTAHSLYFISVMCYGEPEFISVFPSTLVGAVGLFGIIGPAVQAFFANCIRILSSKWLPPCICWFLSFLRFVSVMAIVVASCKTRSIAAFRKQWLWLLVASLAISAAVDVLIAAALCYYLWHRRQTALASTKRVVDRLIAWTIQTGLLTSVATTTMLITFIVLNDFRSAPRYPYNRKLHVSTRIVYQRMRVAEKKIKN